MGNIIECGIRNIKELRNWIENGIGNIIEFGKEYNKTGKNTWISNAFTRSEFSNTFTS